MQYGYCFIHTHLMIVRELEACNVLALLSIFYFRRFIIAVESTFVVWRCKTLVSTSGDLVFLLRTGPSV
jgi:hypothetical protein